MGFTETASLFSGAILGSLEAYKFLKWENVNGVDLAVAALATALLGYAFSKMNSRRGQRLH